MPVSYDINLLDREALKAFFAQRYDFAAVDFHRAIDKASTNLLGDTRAVYEDEVEKSLRRLAVYNDILRRLNGQGYLNPDNQCYFFNTFADFIHRPNNWSNKHELVSFFFAQWRVADIPESATMLWFKEYIAKWPATHADLVPNTTDWSCPLRMPDTRDDDEYALAPWINLSLPDECTSTFRAEVTIYFYHVLREVLYYSSPTVNLAFSIRDMAHFPREFFGELTKLHRAFKILRTVDASFEIQEDLITRMMNTAATLLHSNTGWQFRTSALDSFDILINGRTSLTSFRDEWDRVQIKNWKSCDNVEFDPFM